MPRALSRTAAVATPVTLAACSDATEDRARNSSTTNRPSSILLGTHDATAAEPARPDNQQVTIAEVG